MIEEYGGSQLGSLTMTVPMSYKKIADDIEQRIRAGEYVVGEKLPSYRLLGELYSVSVSTAARAVGLLHDRGLVEGSLGRGVFVKEPDAD